MEISTHPATIQSGTNKVQVIKWAFPDFPPHTHTLSTKWYANADWLYHLWYESSSKAFYQPFLVKWKELWLYIHSPPQGPLTCNQSGGHTGPPSKEMLTNDLNALTRISDRNGIFFPSPSTKSYLKYVSRVRQHVQIPAKCSCCGGKERRNNGFVYIWNVPPFLPYGLRNKQVAHWWFKTMIVFKKLICNKQSDILN